LILSKKKKKKRKERKDMAKDREEDNAIIKEIQKVLLDDSDFLKSILEKSLQEILHTEFEEYIQAKPYERTEGRKAYRNGSYGRRLKTRVGTIELNVLRDREGNFKTELFNRYQRSEKALVLTLTEMYINGVSTRKVKNIVENLCGIEISKSQISQLSKGIDAQIKKWRERPLTKQYPYLMVDARYEDIRKDGMVVSEAVMIVIGIDEAGYREILSVDIGDSESEDQWTRIFKQLKKRGLHGVSYVVSDDHYGLVKALKKAFQGISWQRCQVHFMRNFMGKISHKDRTKYVQELKDIFSAPDIERARKRKDDLVEKLYKRKADVADWLDQEIEYCFTVYQLPESHRQKMKSTNMIERFNQEILRRSRVVRIFPNEQSCIRLVSALSMEKTEEWLTGKKYLDMSVRNEWAKQKEKENEEKSIEEGMGMKLAHAG